jgi:two-component system cell cycle sensor histidine kinase/response regulator CckA
MGLPDGLLKSAAMVDHLQGAVDAWGIGIFEYSPACSSGGSAEAPGEPQTPAPSPVGQLRGTVRGTSQFFELYGLPACEESTLDQVWSKVEGRDRSRLRAAFEHALLHGGDGNIDVVHQVVRGAGERVSLRLRARVHFECKGHEWRAVSARGSVVDITEHERVEQELRRTEARFEEAVRGAQFGIFDHNHVDDPGMEDVYWSPRLREIFGARAGEAGSTRAVLSRLPADDLERCVAAIGRAHDPSGTGFYDIEHRYLHPTLGLRWVLTRSSTSFGEIDGRRVPLRTVGAVIDITARRELQQQYEQRALIVESTSDFVAIADPGGSLVYLNRAARQFLGIGPNDAPSRLDLRGVYPPESLPGAWEQSTSVAARDGSWRGETEFMRHDGALVPMSQVLLAHRGQEGQSLFSMIARDISRERQLEETVREAQKMEAVGRLAAGVAHDFNNILSAILSFAYVVADEVGESGKGHDGLVEIIAAGRRAAALTQQLLAFGRKQVLRPSVVDVDEALNRLLPMLKRLVGEHILVALSLGRRPLRVKVDPTHLEQVLMNLVINARDAMENGGRLSIDCRLLPVADAPSSARLKLPLGRYVAITVSDTGNGMDIETQAHVFEPFFTTKPAGQGTGLGLATVFGIMKQSGGSVHVESAPGRGSVFTVFFPCSREAPSGLSAEESGRGQRELAAPSCAGVVLLAEDDAAVRQVVSTVLRRAGYVVLDAAGPVEALALAREYRERIDLLLTDAVMPLASGKELADRLRELRPGVRVIYMSGYTDRDIVHHGVLDAEVNFLPKPITPAPLLDLVARVLEKTVGRDGDVGLQAAPLSAERPG